MTSVANYNNNPGNLRPKGFTYEGQIGVDDSGFAIFENKQAGKNALIKDIQIKQKRGLNNANDFIDIYTPASKENPEEGRENYKMGLAGHLGLKSTKDPFPPNSHEKIADFIASFESGEGQQKQDDDTNPSSFKQRPAAEGMIPPTQRAQDEGAEPEKKSLTDRALEAGAYVLDKAEENPEIPTAAGLGLGKGVLEKVLQNPEKHLVAEGETTPQQVQAAKDAAKKAQDKIGELKQVAAERAPIDVDSLQREFELRKFGNQMMEDELSAAQKELKGLPKTYVEPIAPTAGETAEQIASRTKPGASGASNWVRAMGEEIPDVLAAQAENMRKDNPKGGQAIIDKYNIARENTPGFNVVKTESGAEFALPQDQATKFNAELSDKQAQQAAEQKVLADQAEAKRLAAEQDLARQRTLAEQKVQQARRAKIEAGERATDARKAANTARQQVAQQARSDASKMETATVASRAAQKAAREAAEAQPGAWTMATREAGRRFAEKAPIIGNILGAAGATMSADEAVDRYRQGDYSGMVLGTIEAALNTASMAPPTSPAGLLAKGVGTVGSIGMIPVWIAHDYFGKKGPWTPQKPQPQKARGGLTLMR